MSIARQQHLSEIIQNKLIIIRDVIPVFPEFLPLSLDIADAYQKYIALYPPYADFNLTNRLSWDLDGRSAVSQLNGNLVLRLTNYAHSGTRTTLMGSNQLERTIETLLTYAQTGRNTPQLELVPEYVIQQLPASSAWHTEEDVDNNDHVLSASRLSALEGPDLRHCRRAIRTYTRKYGPVTAFHRIDVTCPLTQDAILEVFLARESRKQDLSSKHELIALHKLLAMADHLPLMAYGLSIKGKLVAFIICEPMNIKWAIGHFWKADTQFVGIYSYLMYRIAERLQRQGFEYLNTQQDLGIDGLRTFKQSLAPIMHLRKYTLQQRTNSFGVVRATETLHH